LGSRVRKRRAENRLSADDGSVIAAACAPSTIDARYGGTARTNARLSAAFALSAAQKEAAASHERAVLP